MPRGTTLVGLPQPTQSVQNKVYSIPFLTMTRGIRPSLAAFAIAREEETCMAPRELLRLNADNKQRDRRIVSSIQAV
jgi:hypothetical protein